MLMLLKEQWCWWEQFSTFHKSLSRLVVTPGRITRFLNNDIKHFIRRFHYFQLVRKCRVGHASSFFACVLDSKNIKSRLLVLSVYSAVRAGILLRLRSRRSWEDNNAINDSRADATTDSLCERRFGKFFDELMNNELENRKFIIIVATVPSICREPISKKFSRNSRDC